MKLSAIVITKNAGNKIKDCLESLKFADEVIVVDSGSTDITKELSLKAGAKVIDVKSIGYSYSRNAGAQKAKGEWLLYIDADERVTENLQKEINKIVSDFPNIPNLPKSPNSQSFKIFRKNIILGHWLRHGGWWPDPVHRLIKKSALKEWKGELHEYPVVEGEVGMIIQPIIHYSKNSISEMVKNSRQFAPIEAELKLKAGHPPVKIYHFILAMWREFWTRGILKAGWLDGVVGIIEIFYQMFHQFMVYSILWQMQQRKE
jgi:glycosyltransferase involved in cell wall biosynthesis